MANIFNPDERQQLDTPERREELPPEDTLLKAGIRPCDTMLDLGCGTGYFTFPAARLVGPKGAVYAVDVSGVMLTELRSKAASSGAFNIHTKQVSRSKLHLDRADYTFAMISDTLHEVDDKQAFLASVCAALTPGARLAIVEWDKRETPKGPPLKDRISEDEMQVLLKKAGFAEPVSAPLGTAHILYTSRKNSAE